MPIDPDGATVLARALPDRAGIEARIPHRGAMCLLDEVLAWDEQRIRCAARSHTAPDNPLRVAGELPVACGIEYAAQAMALHGALAAPAHAAAPRAGFLASVRAVEFLVARLDDIPGALTVEAERLGGDGNHVLYAFSVSGAGGVCPHAALPPEGAAPGLGRPGAEGVSPHAALPPEGAASGLGRPGAGGVLLRGRAAVVLDAGELP